MWIVTLVLLQRRFMVEMQPLTVTDALRSAHAVLT